MQEPVVLEVNPVADQAAGVLQRLEAVAVHALLLEQDRCITRRFDGVLLIYKVAPDLFAFHATLFALSNLWMVRKQLLSRRCGQGMSAPENRVGALKVAKTA